MQDPKEFLAIYHEVVKYGALLFVLIAGIIFLIHKLKYAAIKDFKARYDYLHENEIKYLRLSFYSLAVSVFMGVNLYASGIEFDIIWFMVRLFFSISAGTLFGYVANLTLKFYYPSKLDVKLKKWRFSPRINPKTGNKMRLLSEDEEDVHLDEGMQAEEEAFSVDYDVWIDEETGDVKIEKYQGHLQALQCNNCGFYTMKVVKEEIVEQPTKDNEGELIKHYECNYCGSIRATQFHIAKIEDPDDTHYAHLDPHRVKFDHQRMVRSIKIEIVATDGHKKSYIFQGVEQATKFLEEFDYDKIPD